MQKYGKYILKIKIKITGKNQMSKSKNNIIFWLDASVVS